MHVSESSMRNPAADIQSFVKVQGKILVDHWRHRKQKDVSFHRITFLSLVSADIFGLYDQHYCKDWKERRRNKIAVTQHRTAAISHTPKHTREKTDFVLSL